MDAATGDFLQIRAALGGEAGHAIASLSALGPGATGHQSLTMRWRGHFGLVSASDAATIPRAPASRKGTHWPRPCRSPPVGSLPTIPCGPSPTSSPPQSRSSHLRRLAGRLLPRAPRRRRYRWRPRAARRTRSRRSSNTGARTSTALGPATRTGSAQKCPHRPGLRGRRTRCLQPWAAPRRSTCWGNPRPQCT
jgi:hypothetical protein